MTIAEPRWTRIARPLWPIAALLYLVTVGFALPAYLHPDLVGWTNPGGESSNLIAEVASRGFSMLAVLLSFSLGGLVYLRRRDEPMALYFAYLLLGYGLSLGGPMEALGYMYLGSVEAVLAIQAVLLSTPVVAFVAMFPSGRVEPRWARWLIAGSVVLMMAILISVIPSGLQGFIVRTQVFNFATVAYSFLFPIPLLVAQLQRYTRIATPTERQQMKWGMYGMSLFLVSMLIQTVPYTYLISLPPDAPIPAWAPLATAFWWVSINIIPVFFTFAILRAGLWNVDLVIRRTLTYSVLTAMLAMLYVGLVLLTQATFNAVIGHESTLAVVISTLVIAALFTPLRRRVQLFVDRRFFRQGYDVTQTLTAFADAVRDEIDIDGVEAALLHAVHETIQPESVGLWIREGR